jgi:hypothetical protein
MSRAVYTFTNKENNQIADVVEFDLLDNPGCQAWQYAVMLNGPSIICSKKNIVIFNKFLPTDIHSEYQSLKDTINNLSTTDFAWVEHVPESFDQVDQDFLNRLHRHFTNSEYVLWDHRNLNFEKIDVNNILQNLNKHIHYLEIWIHTNTKLKYCGAGIEIQFRKHESEFSYDMYPFRKFHSYEPADLILDAHILGKTLIESFACEDDPTNWDTNGHMRTNGGAIVCLNHDRAKIYNSQDFEQWLTNHATQKYSKLADFPLGNFIKGHRSKCESLQNNLQEFSVKLHIEL